MTKWKRPLKVHYHVLVFKCKALFLPLWHVQYSVWMGWAVLKNLTLAWPRREAQVPWDEMCCYEHTSCRVKVGQQWKIVWRTQFKENYWHFTCLYSVTVIVVLYPRKQSLRKVTLRSAGQLQPRFWGKWRLSAASGHSQGPAEYSLHPHVMFLKDQF